MLEFGKFLGQLLLCVCCGTAVQGAPHYVSVKVKDAKLDDVLKTTD